jgi:hypothetical protein
VATAGGISRTSAVVNISVVASTSLSVNITSPQSGAVFTAPASFSIAADTTITGGGTVTNVTFFNNTTPLGSVTSPPFNLTVSNLAAGSYAFTAVATASGNSSTSSVVSVTVISSTAVSISPPVITNGLFSFTYSGDPGSSYKIETSSNLFDWASVMTNAPSSNPVLFSEAIGTNLNRFYRVSRLPNP